MPRSSRTSSSSPFPHRNPQRSSWTKKLIANLPWRRRNELSAHSDLTEETLQEHNLRQAVSDGRNSKCSPYYKGPTDQSLAIRRRRHSVSSPGRESHATTVRTSSSSLSFFVLRIKEWSSCITKNNNKRMKREEQPAAPHRRSAARRTKTTTLLKEMGVKSLSGLDLKGLGSSGGAVAVANNNEKPLRERVSEPESKQTLPRLSTVKFEPKTQAGDGVSATERSDQGMEGDDQVLEAADQEPSMAEIKGVMSKKGKEASVDVVLAEKEFVWATKYRPKALKDFICNRDKALSLQGPVRFHPFNEDVKINLQN